MSKHEFPPVYENLSTTLCILFKGEYLNIVFQVMIINESRVEVQHCFFIDKEDHMKCNVDYSKEDFEQVLLNLQNDFGYTGLEQY